MKKIFIGPRGLLKIVGYFAIPYTVGAIGRVAYHNAGPIEKIVIMIGALGLSFAGVDGFCKYVDNWEEFMVLKDGKDVWVEVR